MLKELRSHMLRGTAPKSSFIKVNRIHNERITGKSYKNIDYREVKNKNPRVRKALKGINSGKRKYIIKKKSVSNRNVSVR